MTFSVSLISAGDGNGRGSVAVAGTVVLGDDAAVLLLVSTVGDNCGSGDVCGVLVIVSYEEETMYKNLFFLVKR